MFIAMNRFRIVKGQEHEFERVWAERDSQLTDVAGFVEFRLLRGPEADDHTLYASHTLWASRAASSRPGPSPKPFVRPTPMPEAPSDVSRTPRVRGLRISFRSCRRSRCTTQGPATSHRSLNLHCAHVWAINIRLNDGDSCYQAVRALGGRDRVVHRVGFTTYLRRTQSGGPAPSGAPCETGGTEFARNCHRRRGRRRTRTECPPAITIIFRPGCRCRSKRCFAGFGNPRPGPLDGWSVRLIWRR